MKKDPNLCSTIVGNNYSPTPWYVYSDENGLNNKYVLSDQRQKVMSYVIISMLNETLCTLFKIKQETLREAWQSQKYLRVWWSNTLAHHGKAHKMNFTWCRYFMEVCDKVRTGEMTTMMS